ncbi:M20 family metallopeptidase [Arthrobacter sp. NPDC058127]|uniref:M20 family metallopeptidase n=1 Tax=Arthrobacter sp. NPDC058127 TaxID=3346351 RepID=UPI0036E9CFAE
MLKVDEDEHVLRSALTRVSGTLLDVSHVIHARPEIRFEEHFASGLLSDTLKREGFEVETGVGGLTTAFLAEYTQAGQARGESGPTLAFFCEYDALEEIGHGCGHNVIAAAGLGAALLAKDWLQRNPQVPGRIVVVGSPGEEGGAGKAYLIDGGCLEGIDAAMMVHPEGFSLSSMATLARVSLDFRFTGRAAHAAVSPERGLNALDAAVLTLNAIGLLRQQLPPDVRVHAVITDGGEVPNIIPETASIRTFVRAPGTKELLDDFLPRIQNCAHGAALATGTEVEILAPAPAYAAMNPNRVLAELIERNFQRIGRRTDPPRAEAFPGSTDMGNVSQIIPSIHPTIELEPGVGMHTREAAALAGGAEGDRAVLDGSLLLAMTAVQLFRSPELMREVKESFAPDPPTPAAHSGLSPKGN